MKKKHLVVLSGAGISAESGLQTFRDSGGLWEGYRIEEVATPEAWRRNPEQVLQFYNARRRAVLQASPNAAHTSLARLETKYSVTVITQNIDDLHERGGSSRELHLHGQILQARSSVNNLPPIPIRDDISLGDLGADGEQLRPNIVWFGEAVPAIEEAIPHCNQADICIVVGTSLNVYPAAGLLSSIPTQCQCYAVDPKADELQCSFTFNRIVKTAAEGIPELVDFLLSAD